MSDDLISQGQLEDKGVEFRSTDGLNKAILNEKDIFSAHSVGRLYFVRVVH